jgi:hypothetical protein
MDIAGKYGTDYHNDFSIHDLRENVHYLSGESAKTQFNVDTVIRYPLPVKPVNGDKAFVKKYSRCEVLLLQKNDIGPLILYCFYTNKGYKKRMEYQAKLEKSVRFKD